MPRNFLYRLQRRQESLRHLLQEYNACSAAITDSHKTLSIEDVLDSSKMAHVLSPKLSTYTAGKRELIDAHLLHKRSIEEKEEI